MYSGGDGNGYPSGYDPYQGTYQNFETYDQTDYDTIMQGIVNGAQNSPDPFNNFVQTVIPAIPGSDFGGNYQNDVFNRLEWYLTQTNRTGEIGGLGEPGDRGEGNANYAEGLLYQYWQSINYDESQDWANLLPNNDADWAMLQHDLHSGESLAGDLQLNWNVMVESFEYAFATGNIGYIAVGLFIGVIDSAIDIAMNAISATFNFVGGIVGDIVGGIGDMFSALGSFFGFGPDPNNECW